MTGFALDTNIVSAHLRCDPAVGDQIRSNTRLYVPATVLGEFHYGAYHTKHREKQLVRSATLAWTVFRSAARLHS